MPRTGMYLRTVTVRAAEDDDAIDDDATLAHAVTGNGGLTEGDVVVVTVLDSSAEAKVEPPIGTAISAPDDMLPLVIAEARLADGG